MEHVLKVKTEDDEIISIEPHFVKFSKTLQNLVEIFTNETSDSSVLPLPEIHSLCLRKIIEWTDYHKNDEKPSSEDEKKDKEIDLTLSPWDTEFLKVEQNMLFEMLVAANYLDMKDLLKLLCKNVASMMKDKTTAQMREIFNVEKDFSSEEEEDMVAENIWVEENL